MFSKTNIVALTGLLAIASARPNVDITREVCHGPACTAHLLSLPLDGNTTLNLPASGLYLTGVNNVGGGVVDLNKIECSFASKSLVGGDNLFTKDSPFYVIDNVSIDIKWISCNFNRANPGKF